MKANIIEKEWFNNSFPGICTADHLQCDCQVVCKINTFLIAKLVPSISRNWQEIHQICWNPNSTRHWAPLSNRCAIGSLSLFCK